MVDGPSAFIINVAFDCVDPRRLAAFWAAALSYQTEFESAEVVRLRSPDQRGVRRLVFWQVPEKKTTKTRVHIDLASKDPAGMIQRLVDLGATVLAEQPGWTVMADPEGNVFCLG
jgi:hypothetical protein